MRYIVEADISGQLEQRKLIELTDDASTGLVDGDKVCQAIDDAEGEINGYLTARYTTPVAPPVPDLLQMLARTIAVYNLYRRRQRVPEDVRNAYLDAIKTLDKIAAGIITLSIGTPSAPSGQAEAFGPERVFSRDTLKNF